MARRLDALEARLLNLPGNSDLAALRDEMAALRGGMQALNARMSGLDRLLERLERGMERQEDRFCLVSAAGRQTLTAQAPGGVR